MKQNYQHQLDQIIEKCSTDEKRPTLLLHACCAPCSSYVLEYLTRYFQITLFFYNPNIYPQKEYDFRAAELTRLVEEMGLAGDVKILYGNYHPQVFYDMAKGLEDLPERGERCKKCYALRMTEAAHAAAAGGFDYFTTTLSISPHKNAEWINEIGEALEKQYGVRHLPSDFKKKNGYKRSCALSEQYGLYRQDYCGCVFSKGQAEKREKQKEE